MARRRRNQTGAHVFWTSLLLSALMHGVVAGPISSFLSGLFAPIKPPERVRMVRLSERAWNSNFQVSDQKRNSENRPRLRRKQEPKKAEPKAEKLKGQVVRVPPTADNDPDPNARFLSRFNSKVKKESVARRDAVDRTRSRLSHKLTKKRARVNPPKPKPPAKKPKGENAEGAQARRLEVPRLKPRSPVELAPTFDGDLLSVRNRNARRGLLGNSERLDLSLGTLDGLSTEKDGRAQKKGRREGAEIPLPGLTSPVPTLAAPAEISGSPWDTVAEGVPEGDGTFLNTKEFKYATFIYRVGDAVVPYWEGFLSTELRRRDPTRRIYGHKDRSTLVRLIMNDKGELENVELAASSGVDFMDDVVFQALRKAQPFPNPPQAMADADGKIRLVYRFIVTMRPSSGVDVYKSLR